MNRVDVAPRFHRNQAIDTRELQRMADLSGRTESVHVYGDGGASVGSGGFASVINSIPEWWVRITAQGSSPHFNYYSWQTVRRKADGTGWEDDDQGPAAGYADFPAIEINNNEFVNADPTTGCVTRAWLGEDGQSLYFDHLIGSDQPQTFSGPVTFTGPIYYPQPGSTTIATGPNVLTLPNGNLVVLNPLAGALLVGIEAPVLDGQRVLIVNLGTNSVPIVHEDSGTTAAWRIKCPYDVDQYLRPGFWMELQYDLNAARWRVMFITDTMSKAVENPTLTAGTYDDYPLDVAYPEIVFLQTGDVTITGFAGGRTGYISRVTFDTDIHTATIKNSNTGSAVGNRIITPGAVDYKIVHGGGFYMIYDGTFFRILDVKELFTTPGAILIVGVNGVIQEKAGLLVNGNQVRMEERTGATRPEMAGLYAGSGNSNLAGGEYIYRQGGYGRVNNADQLLGGVDIKYTGNGTTTRGQTEIFAYDDSNAKRIGLTVDRLGNATINNAATINKLLGTDPTDGHAIVVSVDSTLTLSGGVLGTSGSGTAALLAKRIGFGDGSNHLSGAADFIFDSDYFVKVSFPGPCGMIGTTYSDSDAEFGEFRGQHANGSGASPSATSDGRYLARFSGYRYNGTIFKSAGAIDIVAASSNTADVVIRSSDGTTFTDRVRIYGSDGSVQVNSLTASKVVATDGSKKLVSLSTLDASTYPISNITTAMFAANVVDTDVTLAANSDTRIPSQKAIKTYTDNLLTGLKWKQSVKAATTTNGTLTTAYENGDTVDGVTLVTGDRILIKDQTDQKENGIYTVNASGAPTRSTDADTGTELVQATMFVEQGTANSDSQWTCTNNSITIGSTNIIFAQVSGAGTYSADETSIHLSGNQFSIKSTWTGQTAITTLGTITTGTWNATKIGTAYGGLNLDSSASATGGMLYLSATGVWSVLPVGTVGQVLSLTSGIIPLWVDPWLTRSVATGISAAGSTQGTATALTGTYSLQEVTGGTADQGVKLPSPTTTAEVIVFNRTSVRIKVYPSSGNSIDGLAGDTPVGIPAGAMLVFRGKSTAAWHSTNVVHGQTNHGVLVSNLDNGLVATAAMTDGQLLVGQSSADPLPKTITGDVTFTAAGASAIGTNKVTDSMLRNGAATSVIGRSANSSGFVADISTSTDFQLFGRNGSSALAFFLPDPRSFTVIGASVYRTTNYTLNNNTYTALAFDAELFDTNTLHDTSTNNSRITVPTGMGGKWFLLATIGGFKSDATGLAITEFGPAKNGSFVISSSAAASEIKVACDVTTAVATDYFELIAKQTSGSNQTMLTNGSLYPRLVAIYLGN